MQFNMGGCQNYGPLLGPLNTRCRVILNPQKAGRILTSTHIPDLRAFGSSGFAEDPPPFLGDFCLVSCGPGLDLTVLAGSTSLAWSCYGEGRFERGFIGVLCKGGSYRAPLKGFIW